jgi:hypothetical protein
MDEDKDRSPEDSIPLADDDPQGSMIRNVETTFH